MKHTTFAGFITLLLLLFSCQNFYEHEMIYVEGGNAILGSNHSMADADELPVCTVAINSFYIGKYEVTQSQWESVMGKNPSNIRRANHPVENVSWHDVQLFIERLNKKTGENYRLPTEEEWSYAAMGGNRNERHIFSGSDSLFLVGHSSMMIPIRTIPVGEKMPNSLGIYDMTGNVNEWCCNTYDSLLYAKYSGANIPDSLGITDEKVFKGGSFGSEYRYSRASNRNHCTPDVYNFDIGFRLAKDAK